MNQNAPRFAVIAQSTSAAVFATGSSLILKNVQSQFGTVSLQFATQRGKLVGFSKPVPRSLCVEIVGCAPNLEAAIDEFVRVASAILPMVSLATNAPIYDLQVHLGYELRETAESRPFVQQFLLDGRVLPIAKRRVPVDECRSLISVLGSHQSRERLHRCCVHYFQALQNTQPDRETYALANLYFGVETITEVARTSFMLSNGLTKEQLLAHWGIELKVLDAEVRRRLVFQGDDATYKMAKEASDGLEHGYSPLKDIHVKARSILSKTAGYLRNAVMHYSGLEDSAVKVLTAEGYSTPCELHQAKYFWGTLSGGMGETAAEGELYPMLLWKSTPRELPSDFGEDPRLQFVETVSARVAEHVTLKPDRFELRGAMPEGDTGGLKEVIAPQIEVEQQQSDGTSPPFELDRPAMLPFALALARFILNYGTVDQLSRHWFAALHLDSKHANVPDTRERVTLIIDELRQLIREDELRDRCVALWAPLTQLAELHDSMVRSPLLVGRGATLGTSTDEMAVLVHRSQILWPESIDAFILIEHLNQATDAAAALAVQINAEASAIFTQVQIDVRLRDLRASQYGSVVPSTNIHEASPTNSPSPSPAARRYEARVADSESP
jgi:hypothetical protein